MVLFLMWREIKSDSCRKKQEKKVIEGWEVGNSPFSGRIESATLVDQWEK